MNHQSNNIIPIKILSENQNSNQNINNNHLDNAAKVIELMRFNKINAKNAFDINVNFIESITNMINKNEESSWQKASASLDATAKIYGFRVDCVHNEAFKFLGGLNRTNENEKINIVDIENENDENENKKKENKIRKGQNTLETNLRKLNLTKYDIEAEVDPLFSVMTSKFNESSAKGLLLNTIPFDENLNYILESKKNEEIKNFEQINNIEQKENNINDEESVSEIASLNSIGIKNSQKIDDALKLAENLKEKKEIPKIKMVCSNNFDTTQDEIKNVLRKFITDNKVDDFVKLQLCPELPDFRQNTKIDNEDLNKTFINIFKNEINQADKKNSSQFYDNNSENNENKNIFDEKSNIEDDKENILPIDEPQLEELPENNMSINSQNDIAPINFPESMGNITMALSNFNHNENSFSGYKYEDLIEHASQFGSGSLQNLPQFSSFSKNFGKIEKNSIFSKNSMFGYNNKKEGYGKKNKQEKLFVFKKDKEMNINDLFFESRSKLSVKPQFYDFCNLYDNKRKTKCFYNYDKFSLFKLFVIDNKTIFNKDIENDFNMEQQEKTLLENNDNNENEIGGEINEGAPEIEGYDRENSDISSDFNQSEKKTEKNFGKLYRRFDIRSLKAKILTSYENVKSKEKIDFKDIVINMSKNMKEEEVFSISTPTCFVCMLHLCNEKNLFIEQNDMSTFYIEADNDGAKSARDTKKEVNEVEKMDIVEEKKVFSVNIVKNGIKNGNILRNDENFNNNNLKNNIEDKNNHNNQEEDYEIEVDQD